MVDLNHDSGARPVCVGSEGYFCNHLPDRSHFIPHRLLVFSAVRSHAYAPAPLLKFLKGD